MPYTTPRLEVLLVAPEPTTLQQSLESKGLRVLAEADCAAALQIAQGHRFDAVLVANRCQHQADFVSKLSAVDDSLHILVFAEFSNQATVDELVEHCERRHVELISQSTPLTLLRRALRRAGEMTQLRRENEVLRRQLRQANMSSNVVENILARGTSERAVTLGATAEATALQVGGDIDLATLNRAHVLSVLKQYDGNKARTARALGINRRSLYRLLEKYVGKVVGSQREPAASVAPIQN